VARDKRAAFRDEPYWGRPVPGFGDRTPRILVVGLAPAAHGANRTGRIFTGDRSGDFLIAALYRAGLASAPLSIAADDGLTLIGCRLTSAVHCAPPDNRPTPAERERCLVYLRREVALCPDTRAIVALGALAWQATLRALDAHRPWPTFAHGAECVTGDRVVVGCYHPSQHNTFTRRLTPLMIDTVLARACELARFAPSGAVVAGPY
jgi:uracil-DNA glycosylase family 4